MKIKRIPLVSSHRLLTHLAPLLVTALALLPAAGQAQAIEAWVQRYSGPGNGDDEVYGLAVDASGNVVVTGWSAVSDTNPADYVTIKYSSAGAPLWTNYYGWTGNSTDAATAVAFDSNGNVVVTGWSSGGGSGDYYYVTIKYSSVGVPLWTNRYNGDAYDGALTVDSGGNVVVTGESYNGANYDFLTIKYSNAGALLWTVRYDGPGQGNDWPKAMAVDAAGNVSVTGTADLSGLGTAFGIVTIKYSSAGVPLWTNVYGWGNPGASALALDSSGNVVVTGTSGGTNTYNDFATIKYSSAGVPLWTNRYNGPASGTDTANAMAVDAGSNVYVTGLSDAGGPVADYATIKYSSAGVQLWTNRYHGSANSIDTPKAVAVDASGSVYVTGQSIGSSSGVDYTTVAYSSGGLPLWTNRYNGPANSQDYARTVAVDADGNVYVTGTSQGSGSGSDYATIKYVTPVIIVGQPLSRTNHAGTTASFTVEVVGGLPLSYQWRREGTNLLNSGNVSGVTTTNLQIANVQLPDAAAYTVVVTNAYGSVTSSVAQLTVTVPPNPGRFTSLSYSPAMGFSFIFRDATVGLPVRIQRSSSLAEGSWSNWQSFTYTEPIMFTDLGATGAERRFYRAVSP